MCLHFKRDYSLRWHGIYFFLDYLFLYFWLYWVSVAVRALLQFRHGLLVAEASLVEDGL